MALDRFFWHASADFSFSGKFWLTVAVVKLHSLLPIVQGENSGQDGLREVFRTMVWPLQAAQLKLWAGVVIGCYWPQAVVEVLETGSDPQSKYLSPGYLHNIFITICHELT